METLELRLREGLVRSLLQDWLLPRRAFWLANSGSIGVNPDQRIHEDSRKLCELSADLGVGLLQASILFGTFTSVLWHLSSGFTVRIGEHDQAIPGFMVWAAIVYAFAGSLLSYWVGRSLIGRSAERYAREADLRFSLVRVNEHVDDISLAAGEADEKRRIELNLTRGARCHPPGRHGSYEPHLGDGGIRLGHEHRPGVGGGATLLHRQGHVRWTHDGGGRFHPGSIIPALVHR